MMVAYANRKFPQWMLLVLFFLCYSNFFLTISSDMLPLRLLVTTYTVHYYYYYYEELS